jgi:hypothetical protein
MAFQDFPLRTSKGNISRMDWLQVATDAMLLRFSSVRDCSFLLVNAVFELGIDDRKVALHRLRRNRALLGNRVLDPIQKVADVGRELRHQRNKHAHAGIEPELIAASTMFRVACYGERMGQPFVGMDGRSLPVEPEYRAIASGMLRVFSETAAQLQASLDSLFDELDAVFLEKWRAKLPPDVVPPL